MATFAVSFMTWPPSFQITPSKFCWRVQCSTGVPSVSYLLYLTLQPLTLRSNCRCTAFPTNLDEPGGRRIRTNLRNTITQTLDSDRLWDEYRIDDDIVVWGLLICPCSQLLMLVPTAFHFQFPPRGYLRNFIP